MIDKDKVKAFWDARARMFGSVDFNSIANLEQDPENLALKVRLESEKVFDRPRFDTRQDGARFGSGCRTMVVSLR